MILRLLGTREGFERIEAALAAGDLDHLDGAVITDVRWGRYLEEDDPRAAESGGENPRAVEADQTTVGASLRDSCA